MNQNTGSVLRTQFDGSETEVTLSEVTTMKLQAGESAKSLLHHIEVHVVDIHSKDSFRDRTVNVFQAVAARNS